MLLVLLALLASCKARPHRRDGAPLQPAASPKPLEPAAPWPELAGLPHAAPVRVIALPARPGVPRFDLGGPAIAGSLAIVASSQFGFLAVDFRTGQIAWSKPAGLHLAPPLVLPRQERQEIVLVGDCVNPPAVPDVLLGCVRVVSPAGADLGYVAVHGRGVEAFASARGPQRLWAAGDGVMWRRGEQAVTVELQTGVARAAPEADPPVTLGDGVHAWSIAQDDEGRIVAHGARAWRTDRAYTRVLGAVRLVGAAPALRVVAAGALADHPALGLIDLDAAGAPRGPLAAPVPGIALEAGAIDPAGDVALAVRLDRSMTRDFIAGYTASARLAWVAPLPRVARPDPIGLAIAPDAVVAFHDGDTLTILPALSAPPTARGAPRRPSQNPTP